MSAALQFAVPWTGTSALQPQLFATAVHHIQKARPQPQVAVPVARAQPVVSVAFYRRHTENLLRRYLYASTQIGRSPNLLGESVGRGWVSSRRVRTFEDALIFVLDVERCLARLPPIQRQMICRVVLQEYTRMEAAALLGLSARTICKRLPEAIDRLTEVLLEAGLLVLPE